MDNYKEIIDNLEELIFNKNKSFNDLQNINEKLSHSNELKDEELLEQKDSFDKLKSQLDEFNKQIFNRNEKLLKTIELLNQREQEITNLNSEKNSLKTENQKQQQKLVELNLNIEKIKAELISHADFITAERKNIKVLRSKIQKEIKLVISQYEEKLNKLQKKIKTNESIATDKTNLLSKIKIETKQKVDSKEQELLDLKNTNNKKLIEARSTINKFKSKNKELKKSIKAVTKLLKAKTRELTLEVDKSSELQKRLQSLENENQKLIFDNEENKQSVAIEHSQSVERNSLINNQLSFSVDSLSKKLEESKSSLSSIRNEKKELEEYLQTIITKSIIDSNYLTRQTHKLILDKKLTKLNFQRKVNDLEINRISTDQHLKRQEELSKMLLDILADQDQTHIIEEFQKRRDQIIELPNSSQNLLVVSINPDFKDGFGHFKLYDDLISEKLSADQGTKLVSLVHKECEDSIFDPKLHIRTFSMNSWKTGRDRELSHENYSIFREELRLGLEEVKRKFDCSKISLFMYCGSINQAIVISELIKNDKTAFAHVNTFWDHFNKSQIYSGNNLIKQKLIALISARQLKLYSDSEELDQIFSKNLDVSFDIWPVFSLIKGTPPPVKLKSQIDKIKVFFPGKLRLAKGFDLTVEFSKLFFKKYNPEKYELILRAQLYDNTGSVERNLLASIDDNATIIEGDLSNEEFNRLMNQADVIVLPYKKEEFISRTSGLFCDSIFFGKPMVTTEGTWLGNRIERLGNGALFRNNDVSALSNAVDKVLDSLDIYVSTAESIRSGWLNKNNLNKLTELLSKDFNLGKKDDILYYPAFGSQTEFDNHYFRLLWYCYPISKTLNNIYIPVKDKNISLQNIGAIPDVLDPTLFKFRKALDNKIVFFDYKDLSAYENNISKSSTFLEWNAIGKTQMNLEIKNKIESYRGKKDIWRVDTNNERNEASFYSRLSMFLNQNKHQDLELSKVKFDIMVNELKALRKSKTYVYGTGPSLSEANKDEFDFSDGYNIVCNSMVKNLELLDKLNPEIIVAADPIFHSGCSSYAAAFRDDLLIAMDRYDAYFIVPLRDYKIYIENLPEKYEDKIIGIPFNSKASVNLNLSLDYYVMPFPNILTLFMIPVASTISNEILIMGCDGRKLEDNKYFWSHDKSSQFNDKMSEIKIAHPSFFNIDYNDYYIEHINQLRNVIEHGQSKGIKFVNITKSYIPILEKISNLKYFENRSDLDKILLKINAKNTSIDESSFILESLSHSSHLENNILWVSNSILPSIPNNIDNHKWHFYSKSVSDSPLAIESALNIDNTFIIDTKDYTNLEDYFEVEQYCKSMNIKTIDLLYLDSNIKSFKVLTSIDLQSNKLNAVVIKFDHNESYNSSLNTRRCIDILKSNGFKFIYSEWSNITSVDKSKVWNGFYSHNCNRYPETSCKGFIYAYHNSLSDTLVTNTIINQSTFDLYSMNTPLIEPNVFNGSNFKKGNIERTTDYKCIIGIELRNNSRSTSVFSRTSPPMPFIIGNWKLYDLGKSTFRIFNDYKEEISKDFKIIETGYYEITIESSNTFGTRINVNNQELFSKNKLNELGTSFQIGQGALERFWKGKVYSLIVNGKNLL